MRVKIYACGWVAGTNSGKEKSQWRWQVKVSIHLQTDLSYWSTQPQPPAVILERTEEVAFSDASNFMNELENILDQRCTWEQLTAGCQVLKIASSNYRIIRLASAGSGLSFVRPSFHNAKSDIDPALLEQLKQVMGGRSLLAEEISVIFREWGAMQPDQSWKAYIQWLHLQSAVRYLPGMEVYPKRIRGTTLRCSRCGAGEEQFHRTDCSVCERLCPYCEQCLQLGRMRQCTLLIAGVDDQSRTASAVVSLEKWSLSPAQTEAAEKGLQFLRKTINHTSHKQIPSFLFWAVTGAGKTEMIFPMIEHELKRGARVAVVSPRRDVVLELVPRLAKAFPNETISALYGGSEHKWGNGLLTVATTHQLLRFYQAFHCIMIDELDAFPFHNSPMLAHAVRKACKLEGRYMLLSATPPPELQRKLRRGLVEHVKVPVRFHRHPLPVPTYVRCQLSQINQPSHEKSNQKTHRKGRIPRPLYAHISSSLQRGAQLFVFVPYIRSVNAMASLLAAHFAQVHVAGTHSQDPERTDKVTAFREGAIRILVTTTILERGVTVPKTDVFVVQADHRLFDETSLVQMAGRAGRAHTDPHGRVYFIAEDRTRQMNRAMKQIKKMNRLALKKGYGIPMKGKSRHVCKQRV